jgi:outer membrane biosynthesis protein TonB
MSPNPPSRGYGAASPRFWRNVTLIALAHVALIAGLIRWSLAARSAPDAQSLVWLSGSEDLAAERSETRTLPATKILVPSAESEPLRPDEKEKEQPALTQAKSEIELATPTATPKPAPTAPPNAKATSKPTPKTTPKPIPKKTAKASKSSAHANSSLPKSKEKETDSRTEKKESARLTSAKTKSLSDSGAGEIASAGKGAGHSGGASSTSEFGWYGNMLHDRFYSAWIQPTTTFASDAKISTLVKVRIEKDGRVSKFDIIKPSENVIVNESVAAIAKRVTEVDPPPTGLGNGNHYDVKINFELSTDRAPANPDD